MMAQTILFGRKWASPVIHTLFGLFQAFDLERLPASFTGHYLSFLAGHFTSGAWWNLGNVTPFLHVFL
jgi:hypothetical protein